MCFLVHDHQCAVWYTEAGFCLLLLLFFLLFFFFFFGGGWGGGGVVVVVVVCFFLCVFQCCFTFTEAIGRIRDGEPRTSISTFAQLLSSDRSIQCCFTSTETIRLIMDREPRTATSTFTQLLNSDSSRFVQCCFTSSETVRTVRDVETKPGCPSRFSHNSWALTVHGSFSVALRPQRPFGLLGTWRPSQDVHLDFHTTPGL